MVAYKLTYFDLRGIAEAIRLIFHYLEIPFEDIRIQPENWEEFKPTTPFGTLPFLEADEKVLPTSYAIARYLARQYGLAGKNELEQAEVDALADFIQDIQYKDFAPYMYVVQGYEDGDQVQLRNNYFLPIVNEKFSILVDYLKKSNSGFFMPSGVTWVDFVISQYLDKVYRKIFKIPVFFGRPCWYRYDKECFEGYPELVEHINRIHGLAQLHEYLKSRKHTLYHMGEKTRE